MKLKRTKVENTDFFSKVKRLSAAKANKALYESSLVIKPSIETRRWAANNAIVESKMRKPVNRMIAQKRVQRDAEAAMIKTGLSQLIGVCITEAEIFEDLSIDEVKDHVNFLFENDLLSISDFCTDEGINIVHAVKAVTESNMLLRDHPLLETAIDDFAVHIFESFQAEYELIAECKRKAAEDKTLMEQSNVVVRKKLTHAQKPTSSVEIILADITQSNLTEGVEDNMDVPAAFFTFSVIKALECFGIDKNVM